MDQQRLILLVVFGFSLLMLWEGWQKHQHPQAPAAVGTMLGGSSGTIPAPATAKENPQAPSPAVPVANGSAQGDLGESVTVTTDTIKAKIAARGGDIVHLEFLKHKDTADNSRNFVLFDVSGPQVYMAESGLIGEGLPNHKTLFAFVSGTRQLKPGIDKLEVRLQAPEVKGIQVTKVLTFKRGSYVINVAYEVANHGSATIGPYAYFQLERDGRPAETDSMMVRTFTGPALYTEIEKFRKLDFSDIDKGKVKLPTNIADGWIGMVQHYFVSAWLPQGNVQREFFARKVGPDLYTAGVIVPLGTVSPGGSAHSVMLLYAGPQEQANLEKLAPGLDLVVDYGWLTVIAAPLFWLLEWLYKLVGNWGWAIILLTVLIKAAFFPLSAASYKSMAKMRLVTPKMMKIKEMYGSDRTRMNQEMMELYKKEKINPLGGCLPIVVQIPVFIALYWVLLGTVEMRHAPWILWIHDLSTKDPYFILPLIMGATMLIQTKLNPTPPDPIQAKVMLFMPIVFTGMFLFFPSGLVLYWIVNNVLSIAQQWQITRMIEGGKLRTA